MSYGGRVSETGPDVVRSIIRERGDLSGLRGCPETHGRRRWPNPNAEQPGSIRFRYECRTVSRFEPLHERVDMVFDSAAAEKQVRGEFNCGHAGGDACEDTGIHLGQWLS